MSDKIQEKINFINRTGLLAVGVFCIAYLLFVTKFAECHIQLPFLSFPIFVGELLFAGCGMLYVAKFILNPKLLNKKHFFLITGFAFILYKAITGYMEWGPLALRNAALFYYIFFSVFTYSFYQRKFFEDYRFLMLALLIFFFAIRFYGSFWALPMILFASFLINSLPCLPRIKIVLFVILALSISYQEFFNMSRTLMVGNLLAFVYLVVMGYIVLKIKRAAKLFIILIALIGVTIGVLKYTDSNSMRTMLGFQPILIKFNYYNDRIKERIDDYQMMPLYIRRVYTSSYDSLSTEVFSDIHKKSQSADQAKSAQATKDEIEPLFIDSPSVELVSDQQNVQDNVIFEKIERVEEGEEKSIVDNSESTEGFQVVKAVELTVAEVNDSGLPEASPKTEKIGLLTKVENAPPRSIETAYLNIVFRLFIWRDLLNELRTERPILGFNFGKPFRSVSLEILQWGVVEWVRDGWVGIHNSYLHIIYRSGILGILFIFGLIGQIAWMTHVFVKFKSLTGILLCAALIECLVSANFLLILELPYTAIPIWCLFGVIMAYQNELILKNA